MGTKVASCSLFTPSSFLLFSFFLSRICESGVEGGAGHVPIGVVGWIRWEAEVYCLVDGTGVAMDRVILVNWTFTS